MAVDNKSYVGGPGSFGLDMEIPNHVHEWIADTPPGADPREFMSKEEIARFNTTIAPISDYEVIEQDMYFELIRKGTGLAQVRELASYDRVI